MRVMVLVKASKESEAGVMPDGQLLAEMGKYNEELANAGILLAGEGLHPSSKGVRIRFSGKDRTVIDGPFAETRELLAGYWLWQVKSMADAIAWVKRCPNPMREECEIEIRPVFSAEDFAPGDPTGELRAEEEKLRAQLERHQLAPPRYVRSEEMLIAGLNESYTFETRAKIPSQWHQFAPHIGHVPGQAGEASYGVFWNYRPGQGFDYLTGVRVRGPEGLPAEFRQLRLPAGRYAVFSHDKHVSSLPDTLDAIWKRWLPNSGHEAADAPSFERYDKRFDPETGTGGIEIWVPLRG